MSASVAPGAIIIEIGSPGTTRTSTNTTTITPNRVRSAESARERMRLSGFLAFASNEARQDAGPRAMSVVDQAGDICAGSGEPATFGVTLMVFLNRIGC